MDASILLTKYPDLLIAAGAGFLLGAILAGLWVWLRSAGHLARHQSRFETETALLTEKLQVQSQSAEDLRERLRRSEEESRRYQGAAAELGATKASLEAQLPRIGCIEKELVDIKTAHGALQENFRKASEALAQAREKGLRLEKAEADNLRKEEQITALQDQLGRLKAEAAELRAVLTQERRQTEEKIALLNDSGERLKIQFENLAQRIFEEKGRSLAEQNRTSMENLIGPLQSQIGDFKKRVEDVYDKESRDRAALHTEIHHLKDLNQQISREALNLTRALKGDSKARGNWGEVILERVLEASGLQKGREYEVQVSLKDRTGRRYQPDVIVRLPQGKDVVVDAKVSLKDYETYYSTEDPGKKEQALKAHIESMRAHMRTLAAKSYEDLEGVRSLDFVLLFVPIEAAFLTAVERDRNLFLEAFEKNIMIVSPSTLLVTLRTIENIWRGEHQSRNAVEIAKKAGALYDKFVGFVEALQEIGQQLDRAKTAYQTATDRLVSGRGNLIRRTDELRTLGIKAGKELPPDVMEMRP